MRFNLLNELTARSAQQSYVRQQCGFTLLELMVVLVIATLLLSLAVVGYQPLIENSQAEEASENLRMDVVFSRGEAIKRGGWVGFCGTENGTSCTTNFQNGWLVYHDTDRDKALSTVDTVLSYTRQSQRNLTIALEELSSSSGDSMIFNYRGYPDRPVLFRASKGQANEAFALLTSGRIETR